MTPAERSSFIVEVAAALKAMEPMPVLTEEEQQWVRMAIKREAQSFELRRAIIEKSLASLVWSGIVGIGYLLVDFLKSTGRS